MRSKRSKKWNARRLYWKTLAANDAALSASEPSAEGKRAILLDWKTPVVTRGTYFRGAPASDWLAGSLYKYSLYKKPTP